MFSWVAIDRFAEKERAKDAKFRKQNADKVLRSDAKPLTDDELLAKLRSFNIELDRPTLEGLCRQALSAEEIATPLLDQRTFRGRRAEMQSDWIWVCLTALWQRWFPDQPGFELLDDKIEAGYDLQDSEGVQAACRIWVEAWGDVLGLLDKGGITSIRAFDERFRGSQKAVQLDSGSGRRFMECRAGGSAVPEPPGPPCAKKGCGASRRKMT